VNSPDHKKPGELYCSIQVGLLEGRLWGRDGNEALEDREGDGCSWLPVTVPKVPLDATDDLLDHCESTASNGRSASTWMDLTCPR
jgi:hypothetical protein